jgi:2-polyprenylphenol 6-hydroxylase
MDTAEVDVIIVGAGLVGGTLACALLQGGMSVALVDTRSPIIHSITAHYDQRVFALTRAAENIFRHLGVWQHLSRYSPFTRMEVWQDHGSIAFNGADIGATALGHIVELQVLNNALLTCLQTYEHLTWVTPHHVTEINHAPNHISVRLDNGALLRARVLAGADGAESGIRHLAGIECALREYGHHALVATVCCEFPHQSCARQNFLATGPLAFLPLPDAHTCSIVWSTDPEQAHILAALEAEEFNHTLAQAFELKLGVIHHSQDRGVFPLRRRHAQHYVQERLALLGDAAHTIHPLAGQGVNLGLLDAATLAEVLLHAHAKHRDFGSYLNLRRYERWRKGDNTRMLVLMDGLKQLFSTTAPGMALLRTGGLNWVNTIPPLKHLLMRQAMGIEGDLPPLARFEYAQ